MENFSKKVISVQDIELLAFLLLFKKNILLLLPLM